MKLKFGHPGEPNSHHVFAWAATQTLVQHKIHREHWDFIKKLAETFNQRPAILQLTWAERDKEALAYWTGAAIALRLTGQNQLCEDIAKLGALEVAMRGHQAINEFAS